MSIVVVDARDAFAAPLRGWGRHVLGLVEHLPDALGDDLTLRVVRDAHDPDAGVLAARAPEVVFEQVGLPRIAGRAGAALVHAPNCFLPLRRPCAGVVTIHDLAFESHPEDFSRRTGMKYRWVTPRAARSAEAVICVSTWTAEDVATRYGIDPARIRVIPNAPSLPVGDGPAGLAAAGLPDDGRPYLLAIGDIRGKKNLTRLAEAWQALREQEGLTHRLVLAGVGEPGPAASSAAFADVEFSGYLADGRLDALLRGAAALVHPSLYEGFGLVIAEAMTRGIPVACADATALPETAGGAAVLFDPLDTDAIAAAILQALDRRDDLAAAGRAVAGAYSWERTARETVAVYREVLAA
ncbi:glycosyltransferase family 4 protein [Paraconexibacter sp.]|uniref:glycosyltransferase family 4 protein n=1 Tax=Paraconexibacter sp. TaxID=2949640 RepID=UPI0035687D38